MTKIIAVVICFAAFVYACDAACGLETLGCIEKVTTALGDDPENKEAVCKAYNDMKDCFVKAKCDFEDAMKNMPAQLEDICASAGALQVSFVMLILAFLASFFTR